MTKKDKKWNIHCEQLVEFKRKNGHCMVPSTYKQDKSLGIWVKNQRSYHDKNKLGLDRKDVLDEIGFAWKPDGAHNFKPDDKLWHQQHEKLVEFKRKNAHCMVPNKYEQDESIGKWVSKQRQKHARTKHGFPPGRKDLLDELEFVWRVDAAHNFQPHNKLWQKQCEKLVEFKRKNGNCMVPHNYEKEKPLGHWVNKQRQTHAKNKMRPDRKKHLDELDFVWKAASLGRTRSSSTADVRGLVIGSFHILGRSCVSLSFYVHLNCVV
jgi:uncharacterized protein YbgA (DUF1722 family)